MKKFARKIIILMISFTMVITAMPVITQAANGKVIPLKAGRTYTAKGR